MGLYDTSDTPSAASRKPIAEKSKPKPLKKKPQTMASKRKEQKAENPTSATKKRITANKKLKDITNLMKSKPKGAKMVLFDNEENVIGVLQQNDTPFLFSDAQVKEFSKLAQENNFEV